MPRRVVLDTNVLVSALLTDRGVPGRILDLTLAGDLIVAYDERILAEWYDVLHQAKFGFDPVSVDTLLDFFRHEGIRSDTPLSAYELPDQDDAPFLEVAHAAEAILITGNLKHFPETRRHGVTVGDPHAFLTLLSDELPDHLEPS